MNAAKDQLLSALRRRRDQEALTRIKENPALIDEKVVALALDRGCVKVIRYLRQENKITVAGKEARDMLRLGEFNDNISRFNKDFADIEKHLK